MKRLGVGTAVFVVFSFPFALGASAQGISSSGTATPATDVKPPDYGELIAAKKVPSIYPFQVKVGGQLAFIEGKPETAIFAKLKEPVSADAEIETSAGDDVNGGGHLGK